jgi:hypothetical protein
MAALKIIMHDHAQSATTDRQIPTVKYYLRS